MSLRSPDTARSFGVLAAGILVAISVSGCTSGVDQGISTPPTGVDENLGAFVSATTGAIEGTVVDSQILPIANMSVELLASSSKGPAVANTTTRESGAFEFSLVDPGTYIVRASGAAVESASALVLVAAGEIARVVLAVQDRPTETPYVTTQIRAQIMRCAASYGIAPSRGTTGTPVDETICGESQTGTSFDVPPGFAYVLSETTWAQTSEMLDLYFGVANASQSTGGICTSGCTVAEAWGTPVLRMPFLPGDQKEPPANAASGTVWSPVPEDAFQLTIGAYYAGLFGKDIDDNAGTVCGSLYGHCVGVGYTVEFRYTHFVTVFVHDVVDGIDQYSALPDA